MDETNPGNAMAEADIQAKENPPSREAGRVLKVLDEGTPNQAICECEPTDGYRIHKNYQDDNHDSFYQSYIFCSPHL